MLRERLAKSTPFDPDSQMLLDYSVPRDAMHLLRVKIAKPAVVSRDATVMRQTMQRAEQLMFRLIDQTVRDGLVPGKETVLEVQE
jgi:hypothetical protein